MRTFIFIPPLRKMTGGIAVLYQMAEHLHEAGYETYVVPRERTTPGLDDCRVPVCAWEKMQLTPQDIWLVPEGWVNALAPGLQAKARNVVYVQNWAYLLSALPEGVHWNQLAVSFLNVSHPVAWYTEYVTGQSGPVLRPGIDTSMFYPPESKPKNSIRIAWMPRKNKALAQQIRSTFEARRAMQGKPPVEWVEIHGKSLGEVAQLLRSSHIFLATGFPEGCPLPPLEALASGCILVGYTGFGGWDYMRQAAPSGSQPWIALRDVPWEANALVATDADVPASAMHLEQATDWLENNSSELDAVRKNAQETVAHYTIAKQRDAVLDLWQQAQQNTIF